MKKKRHQKRNIVTTSWYQTVLPMFMLGLFVSFLCWCWVRLHAPTTLPFKHVNIVSTFKELNPDVVRVQVANHVRGGFFSLSLPQLKASLLVLPWVADVSVRRQWPNTLIIHLKERVAVARWGQDALVTREGVIFKPAATALLSSLPLLIGPEQTQEKVVDQFEYLQNLLLPLQLSVQKITLSSRLAWRVTLSNGIELMLGRDDVGDRFLRFVRLYPEVIAPHAQAVKIVDLRYPDGFAVQLKNTDIKVKVKN